MKIKYCFLIVWMLPLFLSAKINVDSLIVIIKNAPDSAKLKAYEELSNYYKSTNFDSCLIICQEGITLSEKLQKAPQMNVFRTNIGTAYLQKGKFESAITYYLEALSISEKYNDTFRIAQTLNNLGAVNMYAEKNDKALEYYLKAKEIKLKLRNNEFTVAIANLNIGNVYKNLKNYDEAYKYYMLALPEIEKSQTKNALATIYNNIGAIFLFRKQCNEALNYYLKAEKFADLYLQPYTRAVLMQNIGECYVCLNKPQQAFSYLDKGLQIAIDKGILHVQKNIYNVLCDYYIVKGNYHKAYLYREKFDIVKDSLFNSENAEKIEELQTKYETEKKVKENLLLTEQIRKTELVTQRQKNISKILFIIVIFATFASILLIYFTHRIKKINTKLQKSTEDLQRLNIDLNLSKAQIESVLEFKTQFIANMSHEIRTPLNIIIGFNSMLKKSLTDPKLHTFIDAIDVSSNNLLQLLNDILDLSKMEAGKMQLAPESINLANLLEDIRKLFVLRAEEKGLDLSIEIEPTVPRGLVLDEVRLRQVLLNLIGNAIKFTDSGFVKLRVFVDAGNSRNISSIDATDLIFEIEDSGIGISEKDQTEIFESFKQIKTHSLKRLGGTGLGLPISKRLTELIGGKIEVSSKLGKGSKFSVILKNIQVVAIEGPEKRKPGNLNDFTDIEFGEGTLIIADDEDLNRSLIKACFENTKVIVLEAQNGDEAIELTRKHNPSVVLMDLKMPIKDGFEAAAEIKNDEKIQTVPILAFTASHLFGTSDFPDRQLFAGFISKPVFLTELYEEVARFVPHTRKSSDYNLINSENEFEKLIKIDKNSISHETFESLQNHFITEWDQINQTNSMNKILEFSNNLKSFANQNNLKALSFYANEIITSSTSFDIDRVMNQIKKFPEIIQILKPTF